MDVEVYREGSNITQWLISYQRDQAICDGIGTFSFKVPSTCTVNFDPWDTIVLWEGGDKKGTYYIVDISTPLPSSIINISCQDGSKKLTDYFITETYFIDYPTYTRYWIEKFLTEAGVSYSFNVSDQGNLLSNNTTLGMEFAMGTILTLLKQSGWYIYFDKDGDAIVGTATVNMNPAKLKLTDQDSLTVDFYTDDKNLRNRVVVYGGTGEQNKSYVTSEVSVDTPWQIDNKDKRTVVYTHSGITSYAVANEIAMTILDEFKDVNPVKTINVAGVHDITIGQAVSIENRDVFNGTGIVTTINSSMSDKGLTTTLILDEKCPRMFGYFRWGDEYVYAATDGSGVHRKLISGTTWENFSTGLETNRIRDLKINNGFMVCVDLNGNAYYRTTTGLSWYKVNLIDVKNQAGEWYTAEQLKVIACAIDGSTGNFYLGVQPFHLGYQTDFAWVIEYDSSGNELNDFQVMAHYEDMLYLYDIDTDDSVVYATVGKEISWMIRNDDISGNCSWTFTALGRTEPDREWAGAVSKTWTNVVMCEGKVYAVRTQLYSQDELNVFRWDHTGGSVDTFQSSDYTYRSVAEERYLSDIIWYDSGGDRLYFYTEKDMGTYDEVKVYYYDFESETFYLSTQYDLDDSIPTSTTKGYIGIDDYKINDTNGMVKYYVRYIDIRSGTWSDGIFLGYTDLKELSPSEGFDTKYGGASYTFQKANSYIGVFENSTVREGSPPDDNNVLGGGSYDDPWIPQLDLLWYEFSYDSLSVVNNDTVTVTPNPLFNITDGFATTHSSITATKCMGGRGSLVMSGPLLIYQVWVSDNGPWVLNSSPPPLYVLLGRREPTHNPTMDRYDSNDYASEVLIDLSTSAYKRKSNWMPMTGYNSYSQYITDPLYYIVHTGSALVPHPDTCGPDETVYSASGDEIWPITDFQNYDIYSWYWTNTYARVVANYRTQYVGSVLKKRWENTITTGNYPTYYITHVDMFASGSLMVFRVTKLSSTLGFTEELQFIEFGSFSELTAPSFITTRDTETDLLEIEEFPDFEGMQTPGLRHFTIIDQTTQPHQLELSQNSIVSTYAYSGSNKDSIRCAGVTNLNFFSLMPDKIVGNWPDPGIASNVWDIRVGKGIPSGRVYDPSGIYNLYAAFGGYLERTVVTSGGGGWTNLATASGVGEPVSIYNVETTNNQYPPSIFYNVVTGSGIIASGITGSGVNTFYQRLSGQANFSIASTDIPTSNITVIRVDDRI